MTIKEARDCFDKFRDDFRPDVRELVRLLRDGGIESPLSNSNYLHALSLTELMLEHTNHSFQMVSGHAGDGFLGCLRRPFENMLRRVQAAGGAARIIFLGGQLNSEPIAELLSKFEQTLKVRRLPVVAQLQHFIVCDDDMVRDEESHEQLLDDSNANEVKAKVYFHNRSMARTFSVRFDAIWRALSGLPSV